MVSMSTALVLSWELEKVKSTAIYGVTYKKLNEKGGH